LFFQNPIFAAVLTKNNSAFIRQISAKTAAKFPGSYFTIIRDIYKKATKNPEISAAFFPERERGDVVICHS
jgi:hypothetical protein